MAYVFGNLSREEAEGTRGCLYALRGRQRFTFRAECTFKECGNEHFISCNSEGGSIKREHVPFLMLSKFSGIKPVLCHHDVALVRLHFVMGHSWHCNCQNLSKQICVRPQNKIFRTAHARVVLITELIAEFCVVIRGTKVHFATACVHECGAFLNWHLTTSFS